MGEETLLLHPHRDGSVEAVFDFSASWQPQPSDYCENGQLCHFDSTRFPRPVAELVDSYGVAELHVALTRGRWDRAAWGHSSADVMHGPNGAEVWARLPTNAVSSSAETRWAGLRAGLSALLCASIEQLGVAHVSHPHPNTMGARLASIDGWTSSASSSELWRGVLPRETACVENLAAWGALLPCRRRAGFGALLRPARLFSSEYHSFGLHVHAMRHNGSSAVTYELRQTISVVVRHALSSHPHDYVLSLAVLLLPPLQDAAPPPGGSSFNVASCPLATSSVVLTKLPSWLTGVHTPGLIEALKLAVSFSHTPDAIVPLFSDDDGGFLIIHEVKLGAPLALLPAPWLTVHRQPGAWHDDSRAKPFHLFGLQQRLTWIGSGDRTRGALDVWIANGRQQSSDVALLVEVPDIVVPFIHTATVEWHGDGADATNWWRRPLLELGPGPLVHYSIPGADTSMSKTPLSPVGAPGLIELNGIRLSPGRGWIRLRFEFESRFLPMAAWPPDPFRGFDWPAAIATFTPLGNGDVAPLSSCTAFDNSDVLGQTAACAAAHRSLLVRAMCDSDRSRHVYSDGSLIQVQLLSVAHRCAHP